MNSVIRHSLAAAATVPISIVVGLGTVAAEAVLTGGIFHHFRGLRKYTNSAIFSFGTSALIGGALSGTMTGGASLALSRGSRMRIISLGSAVPVIASGCAAIAYGVLFRPMGIAGVLLEWGTGSLFHMIGTAAVVTALWREKGYNPISMGLGSTAGILMFSAILLGGWAVGEGVGAVAGGMFIVGALGGGMGIAGMVSGVIQAIHEHRKARVSQ